jgi:cytochrome b6-f complex iron-sulfur subunit
MTTESNSIAAEESGNDLSRRDFLRIAWAITGGAAVMGTGAMALRFLAPKVVEGEFGSVFTVGAVEEFPAGSVTPVTLGRFYLVRQADGGFVALYRKCTHLGCAVPWEPAEQQFVCPCHASRFEMDGQVINAPAPRPLDRFAVIIEGDIVKVDTGEAISRDNTTPDEAVYAV